MNTERLRALYEALKEMQVVKSQEDFGSKMGYKKAFISQIMNGYKLPNDLASKVNSAYPNVNMLWFKHGKGSMFATTSVDDTGGSSELLATKAQLNQVEMKLEALILHVQETFSKTTTLSEADLRAALAKSMLQVKGQEEIGRAVVDGVDIVHHERETVKSK